MKNKLKSNKLKIVIVVIALAAAGAALFAMYISNNKDNDTSADNNIESSLPTITVEHAEQTYEGAIGGHYCWEDSELQTQVCSNIEMDHDNIDTTINASSGDEIVVRLESDSPLQELTAVLKEDSLTTEDDWIELPDAGAEDDSYTFVLDAPEGSYILDISGTWDKGSYSRDFILEI